MTHQNAFTVMAPVPASALPSLQAILDSMMSSDGMADPMNAVIPFGRFGSLHFARFVLIPPSSAPQTPPGEEPPYTLLFSGHCDGSVTRLLGEMVEGSEAGLQRIFSHAVTYDPDCPLLTWLEDHRRPTAAVYVNQIGLTVLQIQEERRLVEELTGYLQQNPEIKTRPAVEIHEILKRHIASGLELGRLKLSPPARTPLVRAVLDAAYLVGLPALLLLLLPLILLVSPFYLLALRAREEEDISPAVRPTLEHTAELSNREDFSATNPFSVCGTLKPGGFWKWSVAFILLNVNYIARFIYTRGALVRGRSIHFAHWAFTRDGRGLFFESNYDGSLGSYADDFMNKVAWGLNFSFAGDVGFPPTQWLIFGGAQLESPFKSFLRRAQLVTQVWYNAYPGLSTYDAQRNRALREGLEQNKMTDADLARWLALL